MYAILQMNNTGTILGCVWTDNMHLLYDRNLVEVVGLVHLSDPENSVSCKLYPVQ